MKARSRPRPDYWVSFSDDDRNTKMIRFTGRAAARRFQEACDHPTYLTPVSQ